MAFAGGAPHVRVNGPFGKPLSNLLHQLLNQLKVPHEYGVTFAGRLRLSWFSATGIRMGYVKLYSATVLNAASRPAAPSHGANMDIQSGPVKFIKIVLKSSIIC